MNVGEYMASRYSNGADDPAAALEQTARRDRPALGDADGCVALPPAGFRGLIELILKDRPALHRLIRNAPLQARLMPGFLAISLLGFALYGVAMAVVFNSAGVWPQLTSITAWLTSPDESLVAFTDEQSTVGSLSRWLDGSAMALVFAYAVGLIAASGICLPSLYFFGLLSGIRLSMTDVVIHALKAKATAAVALVGLLPIYAAASLGIVIFDVAGWLLHATLILGLLLPFVAGFWGSRSQYVGFAGLCDTLPPDRQFNRACFLRRLVFSWTVVYSALTPVMVFTLWSAWSGN